MPKKKRRLRFKRSTWLTCCKKTSSSTTLVSDIDSVTVSQTSRATCQTVVERLSYTAPPRCQACRQEERKTLGRSWIKFWQRANSPQLADLPRDRRNTVELIDIIPGGTNGNTVADNIARDMSNTVVAGTKLKNARENREKSAIQDEKRPASGGKWLKSTPQSSPMSPLKSESYIAIDVRDFIQKINTTQSEDPAETMNVKKKSTKTNVHKDVCAECQHLKDTTATRKDGVQNVCDKSATRKESIQNNSDKSATRTESVQKVRDTSVSRKDSVQNGRNTSAVRKDSVQKSRDTSATRKESIQNVRDVSATRKESIQNVRDVSATRKESIQNVRSVILSRSDGDEVIPVVAEASQTSAQRIFYIEEGSRVNKLMKISCNNDDMVSENKSKHQDVRPEGALFTASDHMMNRTPVRSPRGPKRIVKKVIEDIQTKHIQGISETEVKFKKKKTPIVRHVSQAVQTIVSNNNIVEEKSQSKESIRSKYKRELAVQPSEANHDKTATQKDGANVIAELDLRKRVTDELSMKLHTENILTKDMTPDRTSKVNTGKPVPDHITVSRNSTCPDLQYHIRQSRQDAPVTYLYMPIRRYDTGFETHVFSTKDDTRKFETHHDYETENRLTEDNRRESILQPDAQIPNTRREKIEIAENAKTPEQESIHPYKIAKMKPIMPKPKPFMREQIDDLEQQAYQMKVDQEMNVENTVQIPNQPLAIGVDDTRPKTESVLQKTYIDSTDTEPFMKAPNREITGKVVRNPRQQIESDIKHQRLGASRRMVYDEEAGMDSNSPDKEIFRHEICERNPDPQTVKRGMGADTKSVLTETRTDRQKLLAEIQADRPKIANMPDTTFTSRSDLYTDRDRLVKFKQEILVADNAGVRNMGNSKPGPHTTKSDTDKATELTVYEPETPTRQGRLGRADLATRPKFQGPADHENSRNTRFGHVFPPMQPAMASWYRSYVGESGELFANSDIEPDAVRLGAGLLQASARLVNRTLTGDEHTADYDESVQEQTHHIRRRDRVNRRGENSATDGDPVQEQTRQNRHRERGNLAEAAYSNCATDEEMLMSLGFTRRQVRQALMANDYDICSAAEWLFSGSDIDSTESPRTRARHAREAHARKALHSPIDLIPEDIQEFYNKKKIPPTNKEEYERDLALALLEVEPVPRSDSGSDIMGEGNLEQVNSVGAFYSTCDASPYVKHGKHRTDGDGAETSTDDDRTETSATSGSRTEDELSSRHKDLESKTKMADADDSWQSRKGSRQSNVGENKSADQAQGCCVM